MNFYDLLGVSRHADVAVISAAYRALARKFHPDVNASAADSQRFRQINEAYQTLSNPDRRAQYDEQLDIESEHQIEEFLTPEEVSESDGADAGKLAKGGTARARKSGSAVSNIMWLLLGVPVCFLLGILFAHALLQWVVLVALDWMAAESYSLSKAFEVLRGVIDGLIQSLHAAEAATPTNSYFVVAFGAAWMFICAGASASAVVSHTAEERSNLPLWMVYVVLLTTHAFFAYMNFVRLGPSTATVELVDTVALQLAILAGIISSRDAARASRESE